MSTRISLGRRSILILAVLLAALPAAAGDGPLIVVGDDFDDHGELSLASCRGCGINNVIDGACTNTCLNPGCEDPSRTTFAGGPFTAACGQFDGDQVGCESAWARFGTGTPVSCFYDGGTDECFGCGTPNAFTGVCTNTCITCQDATRPIEVPTGGGCSLFDGVPALCEDAWEPVNGLPQSCYYDGFACDACEPINVANGDCVEECYPCQDASRIFDLGGPGTQACSTYNNDEASCEMSWHTTGPGIPSSCFYSDAQGVVEGFDIIRRSFNALGDNVMNFKKKAVCIGCNDPVEVDNASGAFEHSFDASTLPADGWTRHRLTSLVDIANFFNGSGAININNAGLIYLPSDDDNADEGIESAQLAIVNANSALLKAFIDNGGGVTSHTEDDVQSGYQSG